MSTSEDHDSSAIRMNEQRLKFAWKQKREEEEDDQDNDKKT